MNQTKMRRTLFFLLFGFMFVGAVFSIQPASWAFQSFSLFLPIIINEGSAGSIPPVPASPTPSPTITPTSTSTSVPTIAPTATATDVPGSSVTVIVGNNFFDEEDITIKVGDTVIWQREAGFHNMVADDSSFRLGEPPDGEPGASWETAEFTFTEIGVVPYYCQVHGAAGGVGMAGTITVEAE